MSAADRELLELAAKAAGIDYHIDHLDGCPKLVADGRVWNPLTDDGDRYRLLSKLKMHIDFESRVVFVGSARVCVCWPEDEPDEARSIVRAAAKVGKAMP